MYGTGQMCELQTEADEDGEQPKSGNHMVSVDDAEAFNVVMSRQRQPLLPDMDALNGMLTAFVCAPEMVKPPRIVAAIMRPRDGELLQFKDREESKKVIEIMERQLVDLHYVLSDSNRCYKPYIKCETKPLHHWAWGFSIGVHMGYQAWKRFLDDKQCGQRLFMMFAYAAEDYEGIGEILKDVEMLDRHRAEVIENMSDIIQHMYDYFADDRKKHGNTYPRYFSTYVNRFYTVDGEAAEKIKRTAREQSDGKPKGKR